MRTRVCTIFAILFVVCNILNSTKGETIRWNGGSGYFNDASMWTPPQIPGPDDDVYIVANGTYNVVLDTEVTTVLGNLTVGGYDECICTFSERCAINLYVQSPLNVTSTFNLLEFGVLILIKTELSVPTLYARYGAIFGSGFITAETKLLASMVSPGQIERLSDPADHYVILSSIGELNFIGNVYPEGETFFLMHVRNETNYVNDKIVVDGTMEGTYSRVMIVFIDTPTQYDITFEFFSAPNISVPLWDVQADEGESENEADIITPMNCLLLPIGRDCKGCPMSGFSIILMTDQSTCCPADPPLNCPGEPDCNGQGECRASPYVEGLPQCMCDEGWTGNACDIADCSGFGSCNYQGTCDAGICLCEKNFTGVGCADPICSSKCLEHGKCHAVDSLVYCNCDVGYEGPECDQRVPEGECPDDCNGRGKCQCDFGPCYCDCSATYDGPSCAYARCESSCHHGQCVANATASWCTCDSGWGGNDCTFQICPSDCSGNGLCVSYGGAPKCNCEAPWTGADCSMTEEISNGDGAEKESSNSMPIAVGVSVAVAFVLIIGAIIAGVVILNRKKAQRKRARDNVQSSIMNSQL